MSFSQLVKFKRFTRFLSVAGLMVASSVAAVSDDTAPVVEPSQPIIAAKDLKVALLFDMGGKFDKSFNEAAYNGAERWALETGGTYRGFEPTSETQFEQALKRFSRRKVDLVVAVGLAYQVALSKIAPKYPDMKFAVIDAFVDAPNVRMITFKENEGSFLVGALAAMKNKTGTLGFMGGMDIPLIRRFAQGYREGALYIRPDLKFIENYVGTTPAAWSDPIKAGELARGQFSRGADIIYAAAGPSGLGVIQAAKESGNFAIGVDSNQNDVAPGSVLTSMLKRVDVAVYRSFMDRMNGNWSSGQIVMTLKEGGVDYAVDEHNEHLVTEADRAKLEEIKNKIVDGTIVVGDVVNANAGH